MKALGNILVTPGKCLGVNRIGMVWTYSKTGDTLFPKAQSGLNHIMGKGMDYSHCGADRAANIKFCGLFGEDVRSPGIGPIRFLPTHSGPPEAVGVLVHYGGL